MPRLMYMGPPGKANALISRTLITLKEYRNSRCSISGGMTCTRRRPIRSTNDSIPSSRRSGNCCSTSFAACWPSSTSCAGVYLLLGAVMRVWATASEAVTVRKTPAFKRQPRNSCRFNIASELHRSLRDLSQLHFTPQLGRWMTQLRVSALRSRPPRTGNGHPGLVAMTAVPRRAGRSEHHPRQSGSVLPP